MDALAAAGDVPDWVMLLQPTSPLRGPEDIRAAAAFTLRSDVESVISVCEAVPPPEWTKRMTPEGWLEDVFPHETPGARQQLVTSYVPNGAIYLARSRVLRARHSFYAGHTHGYIMPRERSVDIDTPWDLEIAEAIIARGTRGPR
jgi:N-acylneuraminate cytidylyltransferase/CMP-N,N'-diacetyllegionaminic acid synthase